MKLTVIIPAHNEEAIIASCLEALVAQTMKEGVDVIVVDNGSTDKTAEIVESFTPRLNVRVVREDRLGRGSARVRGCKEATGDILLSTDADAIVPPDWVSSFVEFLQDHPNDLAVTSPPRINDCSFFQNVIFNAFVPHFTRIFNCMFFGHPGLYGFSFAIRKEAYERSGGFSADDDAYEDLMLAERVHKLGRIGWIREPCVLFSGRRFKHGLLGGWLEYVRTFYKKFIMKKKTVLLTNKR